MCPNFRQGGVSLGIRQAALFNGDSRRSGVGLRRRDDRAKSRCLRRRLHNPPHRCSMPWSHRPDRAGPQRGLTMQITHQSRFRLLSALTVATLFAVVLVGCSDDPSPAPMDTTISSPTSTTAPAISNTPTSAPTSTATAAPTPTATPTPEPTPVVLGDCRDGMRLQPGEGCRYTGGGSPQANVVLSVQHDGAICREGGAAKREIGSTTLNMAST